MARIRFTDHARRQIIERKLPRKTVISAVEKPASVRNQADGRLKMTKLMGKKIKATYL